MIDQLPAPVFSGFFPKLTSKTMVWLGNDTVKEICSVSTCISGGPEDWINQWKHNGLGFYDSESLAYQVAVKDAGQFEMYAYTIFPFRATGSTIEYIALPSASGVIPADYEFLGYDIVTKSRADFFECSPLSCNAGAKEYPVNEFCLLVDLETGYRVLLEISQAGTYEPGPYYLFGVYRKKSIAV